MSQKPSSRFVEQAQASGCVREALIPSAPVLDGGSSSLEKTRAQHSDPAPYHADKLLLPLTIPWRCGRDFPAWKGAIWVLGVTRASILLCWAKLQSSPLGLHGSGRKAKHLFSFPKFHCRETQGSYLAAVTLHKLPPTEVKVWPYKPQFHNHHIFAALWCCFNVSPS